MRYASFRDFVDIVTHNKPLGLYWVYFNRNRGRPGFDVGCKAMQGIPRASDLVNPSGNLIVANDDNYALAA